MQNFITALAFIALFFIKIGDGVIFLGQSILQLAQKGNQYRKKTTSIFFQKIHRFLSQQQTQQKRVMTPTVTKRQLFKEEEKQIIQSSTAKIQHIHMLREKLKTSITHSISIRTSTLHTFFKTAASIILFPLTLLKAFSYHKRMQKPARKRALDRPHKKQSKRYAAKEHYKKPIASYPKPIAIKMKYFFAGFLFSFLFLFLPLLMFILVQSLPNPRTIALGQMAQTTKIYDRNGILLYQIYASQNRTVVPLSNVPTYLKQATIAIEDKDFYKHPGFDVTGIARSAVENIKGEKGLQGGSTITQQLMKSSLLTPETSYVRKIKEVILAFWAERIYTKDQILEMYFNQVPYGGTAWGVESASQVYFGKDVKDLDLAESAFLAGIPRAPSIYSPYSNTPDAWKHRQKTVLHRMVVLGYITPQQAKEAENQELHFREPQTPIYAPHFVMYVKDLLVKKYGLPMVEKGGLTVITSLDLKKQEMAQEIVREEVAKSAHLNLTNAAALVTNPKNGDIIAMVGSKDFYAPDDGNVNITTSLRQPGSSIKPVTYSAALAQGITAATLIDDAPITYTSPGAPPYTPVNYDGRFHGRVPFRHALANSFNIPAVKMLERVGVPTMVNYAKRMGIRSWGDPDQYGLSLTLGSGEVTMVDMATVYGTFANLGKRVDLNPFLKVTDANGYIWEEKRGSIEGTEVLAPGIAYIISDILADNTARALAFGPTSPLTIPGHTVSVKTGTTDYKRDNWTIGYTPELVVATWVGNNDNTPMSPTLASGISGAAPIWNKIITNLLAGIPDQKSPMPPDVVQKVCMGRVEYFLQGTENTVNCERIPVKPSPIQVRSNER